MDDSTDVDNDKLKNHNVIKERPGSMLIKLSGRLSSDAFLALVAFINSTRRNFVVYVDGDVLLYNS